MANQERTKERRVVVTGLGVVSSIGIGWQEFWKNLIAGKCGIKPVTLFDTSMYDRHFAGEITNFDPERFMPRQKAKEMGRTSQMALAAALLALEDARLTKTNLKSLECGVCLGTTMGESRVMEDWDLYVLPTNDHLVDTLSAGTYPANLVSSNVAIELQLRSYNLMLANACSAGNFALGYAYDLIRSGHSLMMLAGGADALSRISYNGFFRLYAIAPEKCQPFDKNRQGMIPGEGSAVLVLENLESAQKRGASVYAEVLGYGISCDARHMTEPDPKGICKAFRKALRNSGIGTDDVDYISAHGTGTKENDKAEAQVLQEIFGERAGSIPMSSIKSALGHAMGASSAMEAVACCLTINEKILPPTINFETPDPECPVDCVPNQARKANVEIALNNSLAFGGNNACLVLNVFNEKH